MTEQKVVDGNAKEPMGRREARAQRRAERRAGRGGWVGGVLLIALGVLFLLQNAGFLTQFTNWWALFIMLPALGLLSAGFAAYRRTGGWTAEATGPFTGGLLLAGLSMYFFLGLDIAWLWPLFLIGAGVLLLLSTLVGRS